MRTRHSQALVVLCVAALSACGGGGGGATTPTSPSTLSTPTGLTITRQEVTLTQNVVQLSWSGTSSTYRVLVGSAPLVDDVLQVDVSGTSHTWTAPREANAFYIRVVATNGSQTSSVSNTVVAYTIDMRHVIDAMYFRSGPMADTPDNALGNPFAAVWADGLLEEHEMASVMPPPRAAPSTAAMLGLPSVRCTSHSST